MTEFNKSGMLTREADFVVGLNESTLKRMKPKELAAKYCQIDSMIGLNPNSPACPDLEKAKTVYEQEFFRRAMAGEIHPDDFEKYCDEWFKEHESGTEKSERLNSEFGYISGRANSEFGYI